MVIGAISSIEYERDCLDIKHLLVSEADGSTEKNIMSVWNKIVFVGVMTLVQAVDSKEKEDDEENFVKLTVAICAIDIHNNKPAVVDNVAPNHVVQVEDQGNNADDQGNNEDSINIEETQPISLARSRPSYRGGKGGKGKGKATD
jgi:hypothetical protein